MKKLISLLLAVCLLLGLVPMASAADSLSTLERALVETALTFYYKGNSVQYDSYYMGKGNRYHSGILRQTNNREPEEATPDDIHYSVCSAFPHDAYFSAFGEHIVSRERQQKVAYKTHTLGLYLQGMNLTDEELGYELGLDGVTATYVAVGEHFDDTGENIDNMVIGYWGPIKDANGKDTDEFTNFRTSPAEVQAMMRPGDIIAAHPKTVDENGEVDETGGHTMMFLGDIFGDGMDYVIHSSGSKYNNNDSADKLLGPTGELLTGHDRLEAPANWANYSITGTSKRSFNRNGTIIVTPFADLLGSGKSYDVTKCYDFAILRPLNTFTEADLTPSAKFRLHHPALGIYKTADVKPYRDVKVGDTITYTIRIDNNTRDTVNMYDIGEGKRSLLGGTSGIGATKGWGAVVKETSRNKTYSDLVLTETLPAGTTFVSSTVKATQNGSTLTWNVPSVSAGNTTSISYTVKVTGGNQIVSPKGTITATGEGRLQTKELTHEVVAQQLDASKIAAITASSVTADATTALRSGTDVAEDVYGAMGYDLQLPDAQQLTDLVMKQTYQPKDSSANRFDFQLAEESELTTAEAKTLHKMIVPGMIGGARLHTVDENGARTNENRLRVLRQDFLQPGDVLVYANTAKTENGTRLTNRAIISENAYVYLGNDNFAYYENGKLVVKNDPIVTYWSKSGTNGKVLPEELGSNVQPEADTYGTRKYSYSEIFHRAFLQDVFVVLRPSRVGLNSTAAAATSKAVELKASGSTYYADLKSAVAAAADGDTLVLHEDISLSKTLSTQKSLTIDFNGHTITSTATEPKDLLNILNGADSSQKTLLLKNGTVDGPIYVGNSAIVRFENMTLQGRDWEYISGTITRYGAAVCKSGSSSLMFKNCNIMSKYATGAPLQQGNTIFPYNNVTFENDVVVLMPTTVTWDHSSIALGENVQLYAGTEPRSIDGLQAPSVLGVGYLPLTFTANPSVYNETTGVYYASFSEAGKQLASGDTLQLLRDVDTRSYNEVAISCGDYDDIAMRTKYLVSTASKSWTLDLNGHTINDPVMGAGTVITRGKVSSGYTFTVKNGTMVADKYCINNGVILNLENVTLLAGDDAIYMSDSGDHNQVVNVKGGTIVGGTGATTERAGIFAKAGTLSLTDGAKVLSLGGPGIIVGHGSFVGTVNLHNATVGTNLYAYNVTSPIRIGTGSVNVAEGFKQTAARAVVVQDVNGIAYNFVTDVYAIKDPQAQIGQTAYANVESAMAAAKNGDTVTLVANASVDSLTIPEGVTLDVADYILTLNVDATLTVAGTVAANTGRVESVDGWVVLEGKGDYLGITVPKGVEGTVCPDTELTGTFTVKADSTIAISGTVPEGAKLLHGTTGEELAAENGTFSLSVTAKEMTEAFSAVPVQTEDSITYVGKTQNLNLRTLAENALKQVDWQTQAHAGRALVAMLDYGAAAQTYFGHKADDLANSGLAAYRQHMNFDLASARKDTSSMSGPGQQMILGASCVLGQDLGFKLYFDFGGAENVTVDIAWGDVQHKGLTPADLTETAEGYHFYQPEGFALKDFEKDFTITVYHGGTWAAEAVDSASSYVARLHGTGETALADAILTYALAVKALS